MKKIVLTGGGTAGHCMPNLALLPALKEAGFEAAYIGSYNGMEKDLAVNAGLPYHGIATGKLRRYFSWQNFTDPFRVAKGIGEAKKLLSVLAPDVVFSKGGYVAFPVVKAASALKIPVVAHESDLTPGLSNRLSFRFADRICCSFPETLKMLPKGKGVLTGTPVRSGLKNASRERALSFVHMREGDYPFLLVMGGSQGAQRINEAVRQSLPSLLKRFNIIHLCGRGKVDPTLSHQAGYMQYDYIDKELPDLFCLADVVVSRAGANAIFELVSLKKPHILIPLATGRGDQLLNASSFEKAGYSKVLLESDLKGTNLADTIDNVFENRQQYISAMEKASSLDPAGKILEVIQETAH
ncbi:MAG: undecaprenyldiphospho-muramoylpentapeptide beta-N-acetylglucosaminyltransferase [Lachnospiraceae bacterium]|nr:undecaprenyldiphospho-muramoylpentapeptide beta-N-acetylglucosaminyltransferase [Lachnospiraceae bacterium]